MAAGYGYLLLDSKARHIRAFLELGPRIPQPLGSFWYVLVPFHQIPFIIIPRLEASFTPS